MKFAVFVLSDPKAGEEALGRVFNALAFAAEAHASGDEVAIVFQGAGTRWPAEFAKARPPGTGALRLGPFARRWGVDGLRDRVRRPR